MYQQQTLFSIADTGGNDGKMDWWKDPEKPCIDSTFSQKNCMNAQALRLGSAARRCLYQ
jgi:hypothetical protein